MNKGRKVVGKFTAEMVRKVADLNANMVGTSEWYKYHCLCEKKRNNGKWFFIGWYTPDGEGDLVRIGDKLYVYRPSYEWCDDIISSRYQLSDNVIEALGLEVRA